MQLRSIRYRAQDQASTHSSKQEKEIATDEQPDAPSRCPPARAVMRHAKEGYWALPAIS